ncbi:MAG: tRNA (guanosine(37)-N1)-methyltransferase TrmD [Bacteroidetes bacterium]|nr:tRNA (guanosine(37)-N1)-methyltransferase TrmD [Bacteroidota bacterium]
MDIDILTIFPEMFAGPFDHSIIRRAREKGLVNIGLHNIRDHATGKHKKVDDYAYSGGAGMVMMVEPIARSIRHLLGIKTYDEIIMLSPDGEPLTQQLANFLSTRSGMLLLCGHYKGVDERVRERFVTREISIGDYVISGGELAAMVLTDVVVRLLPGALNDETSALSDSFQDGLISPPVYTRPAEFEGMKVPDILLSGNEKEIRKWQLEQALERTRKRRPGLLPEDQ